MYDLTSLVIISACLLIAGLAGGYLIGRFTGTGGRALELESELETSQNDLDQYKEQVYQEFGETAKKFEKLQETYTELHTQLAQSAENLCGSQLVGPMLAAPAVVADGDAEQLEQLPEEETPVEDLTETETAAEAEERVADSEELESETTLKQETADQPEELAEESTDSEEPLVVESSDVGQSDEVLQDSEADGMTSAAEAAAQADAGEIMEETMEAADMDELLEQQSSSNVTQGNFGSKKDKDAA